MEILAGTAEPVEQESFTLKHSSAIMNTFINVLENRSPGKIETSTKRLLTESSRKREIENAARLLFLGTLPEE